MGIILDTDVIINAERRSFDLTGWIDRHPNETFAMAAVTIAELQHGLERSTAAHRQTRSAYLQRVLLLFPVIPYTERTAFIHAHIWAKLESAGKIIGAHDLIVAATALERHASVATFNVRHFSQVQGLTVIHPVHA